MGKIKISGIIMIFVGVLCVTSALSLFLYNMWDDARAGIQVAEETERVIAAVLPDYYASPKVSAVPNPSEQPSASALSVSAPHPSETVPARDSLSETPSPEENEPTPSPSYRDMPVKEIDGVRYAAILSIPDLNLELPVQSDWSYPALKLSPCRYSGSAYMDDLVICAHSYSQHFGRLRDLNAGSEVLLVDMEGNLFRYRVVEIEAVKPTAIHEMIDSSYDLSLFTCSLSGSTRTTARCERVDH